VEVDFAEFAFSVKHVGVFDYFNGFPDDARMACMDVC
jgi:hypothetical protein